MARSRRHEREVDISPKEVATSLASEANILATPP
eukprot:CAMPEP_0181403080 /NCGR_PEP_ID=MMETSP1110-20121109/3513_1 /TAXON_ID=174948 /ORGANISM="Symbiodinium sp., Strain CCMP421" /LENGTH=33 /DNA_ID= /DNA_START= /DNA_END= /DNA_ORIENTATION=